MNRTPQLGIAPVTIDGSDGPAQAMLTEAKARLGFVPNMYGYMANLPPLLATYLGSYDGFRTMSGLTPAEQETVFLTISRVNGCTYCMAAHSMIADRKSGVSPDNLAALRAGEDLPDPKLQAVAMFTETMLHTRGNPGRAAVDAFAAAGYGETQVLGIVLAIACKSISNSVNHLAATPVDALFAAYAMP